MRRSLIALIILTAALLALAARTPALDGSLSEAQAYLPFVVRQLRPTATPTITPTPIPPFAGVAQIHYTDNAVDGWGWPPRSSVIIDVTSLEGTHKDTVSCKADSNGNLPWSEFNAHLAEGDWITVTLDNMHAGFPIQLVQATGDPATNTIAGRARPSARVAALVGHGEGWFWLETDADARGDFLLDFSSQVDWDYDDYIRVGQYLNANGLVNVTGHSEHFRVMPPPTATPTLTPSPTPTRAYDAPPYIHIEAPSEATVGEEIVLDASGTWDVDGDPFELRWRQFHNPDRYIGIEYVTGNDVPIEAWDGSQTATYPDSLIGPAEIRFQPEWPGNYRFELIATDKDGLASQTVDVTVYPSVDLFPIRGMAIDGKNGPWSQTEALRLLEYLKSLGFNYVHVGMHDTMESPTSNEMLIDECQSGSIFLSLEESIALTDLAHDIGLGVMLNPHLGCNIGAEWYEAWNISPTDPRAWMDSFREYALFYAQLAQEHDVEILYLAGGMDQFYGFTDLWRQLIDGVHNSFDGQLALGWFNCQGNIFPLTADLDMLGHMFSYNGSGESCVSSPSGHSHPTVGEMAGWFNSGPMQFLEGLQASYGKGMVATDLYPFSLDGMNINPVQGYWTDIWIVDNQEPIDYAEAAFRVMASRAWQAVFFWSLAVGPPMEGVPEVRGKPIEEMIRVWFSSRPADRAGDQAVVRTVNATWQR